MISLNRRRIDTKRRRARLWRLLSTVEASWPTTPKNPVQDCTIFKI